MVRTGAAEESAKNHSYVKLGMTILRERNRELEKSTEKAKAKKAQTNR